MNISKSVFVGVLSLVLVACGGGSETSGGEVASPTTLKITVNNAEGVAKAAVSGEDAVFDSGAVAIFRSVETASQDKLSIKYLSKIILKQSRTSGLVSLARSTRATEIVPCPGGGSMSFSGTEENGTATVVDCFFDGMLMNGSVAIIYSGSGDVENYLDDYQEDVKMTFSNVTVNVAGVSSLMDGTVQFVESYSTANQRIVGTDSLPSFSLTVGAESFKIYDSISEWEKDYTVYSWNDSGTFDDSSIGVFSYDTLTTFEQNYDSYPHAGKIKIVGSNSSLVISIVDTSSVTLELDSDGDSVIDETWSVSPSELGFELYSY